MHKNSTKGVLENEQNKRLVPVALLSFPDHEAATKVSSLMCNLCCLICDLSITICYVAKIRYLVCDVAITF